MSTTTYGPTVAESLQQPTDNDLLRQILFGRTVAVPTDENPGTMQQGGLFNGGNGGFVEGTSDALDWANTIGGSVPVIGDILGLVSRQRAADQARRQQDAANRANEARYQESLGLNTQGQALAQERLNQTGQWMFDRIGRTMAEFDKADQDLGRVGETARRDISGAGVARSGQVAQQMAARGLTNSTVADQAQLAAGRDTQRSFADLNERLAGIRGNLGYQRAATRANVEGDLGNFMNERRNTELGLLQDRAGTIERRVDRDAWSTLLPQILQQGRRTSSSGGGGLGSLLGGVVGGLFG